MNRNFYLLFFCVLAFVQIACAQTQPNNSESKLETKPENKKIEFPNLKKQADEMGAAFLTNDYDKFADYMYPKIVEAAGGRDNLIKTLKTTMNQMKSEGFELASYEVGEPSEPIKIDNQMFSVLPTTTRMKAPARIVSEQGSILAVSEDNGDNWKFIRVTSKEKIRPLFPKAVDKLSFPETVTK